MKRNTVKKSLRMYFIPKQRNKQKSMVFTGVRTIFRLSFLLFIIICYSGTAQPSFAMNRDASTLRVASKINPICISSHIDGASKTDVDKQAKLMAQAGIAWVRFDFDWASFEQTKGVYTWSNYDYIVNTVISKGMQVLALVPQYDLPVWERVDPKNWQSTPNNMHDFQTFVRALATHYKGKISLYEIGNEPNEPPGLKASAYTQLLIAGYNGVKAAASTNKVISAGLANYVPESNTTNYINAMYASGAKGHFDYFGFHPYSWPANPDFSEWSPRFNYTKTVHQLMIKHGDGSKGIMITEVGWPSSTASGGVNEATQATYINRVFQKIMYEDYQYVTIACVYDFIDDGSNIKDPEQNFGILRSNYSQKSSFKVLQQLSKDYKEHNNNDTTPTMYVVRNLSEGLLIVVFCTYCLFYLFREKARWAEKKI